jgi:hypothetical protein
VAIVGTDILIKLSTTAGSAGNQNSQADPNASLGKYISTSAWAGGSLHDLFDVISGEENAASEAEYRCIFVHNNHGSLTWFGPVVWISAETANGASIAIGVDTTAESAIGSASAQAVSVANENTAPSGITFSSPTTKGTGVSLGDIPAGHCRALWIRRTAANNAAIDSDGGTLTFEGDTAA